jgi:phosphomannomutase
MVIIEHLIRAARHGVKVDVLVRPPHTLQREKLVEGVGGLRIMDDVGIEIHKLKHLRTAVQRPCSPEITARAGHDPGEVYRRLMRDLGDPVYARIEVPAGAEEKRALAAMSEADVHGSEPAGEPIQHVLTVAPGNQEPIGGIKVVAPNGWFAARPSGTEHMYKIYAESFRGETHLQRIEADARRIVAEAIARRRRATDLVRDRR